VLLAGGIALGADVIVISKIAATAAGIATVCLAFQLGQQELDSGWAGALIAGALAINAGFARYAVSGFETLPYGMLIILGLYLYLKALKAGAMPFAAAVALALAAMTRPEGTMVYSIVTLHYVAALWLKPDPLRGRLVRIGAWLLIFGVMYAPYFAWRYTYYNYPLPNTFYAKVGEPALATFRRGLLYLRDVLLLVNPQAVLCLVLGLFWRGRRKTQALLYGLAGIYLGYIIFIGGDQQAFFGPRFIIPLLPLVYILGVGGAIGLAAHFGQRGRRLLWVGLISFLVCIFAIWSHIEREGYLRLQNTMHRGWITLGYWLAAHAQPGDSLAIDAAGIIPFYTHLYTIDMFGLNDLHIAHRDMTIGQGLPGHEKFDPPYVLARNPTYIAGWLDKEGRALYFQSDLPTTAKQFADSYDLWAIVLMRPPINDEASVIVSPTYTPDLNEAGYIYGIFRRNGIESK
jgi:arabinofuranosyltransferase